MCGICGKLNFDRDAPADSRLLQRMTGLLHHRGPDATGQFIRGPVALGHRRLAIIDLHTGDQPMCNEDGTVWVVYNGEIYNFLELRKELLSRGHRFKSESDTEVIVHMYEEMGDECVRRFRGMFAFALWDSRREHLLLARDHVGIKPLYYAQTNGALLFASEIKSILADPAIERRMNANALDRFLTYYYLPGSETLLDGVSKLEPGHYLTVDRGRVSVRKYWDLEFDPSPRPRKLADAAADLRSLISQSVKDHLISDVPVGVLLSGGVDSTGVLRYAAEHSGAPLHTFTVGFGSNTIADERPFARLAAQRFGTLHQEISMSAGEFRDLLSTYVWHMEEPVCEPPAIALYLVSRLARESSVKVLLSGEGGDEAFAGYPEYRNLLLLERLKSGFAGWRPLLRAAIRAGGRGPLKRAARYADLVEPKLSDYYFSRTASPLTAFNRLKSCLYADRFAASLRGRTPEAPTRALFAAVREQPALNQMLYVDSKSWLPDDLLVKADKMTMAASVELRVPLLDSRLLEFAASLPADCKVKGWQLKRVLKAALESSVPTEIIRRKKAGFPVPYAAWLRTELREFVLDTLLAPDALSAEYLSRPVVRTLAQENARDGSHSTERFSLHVLELWLRQFWRGRGERVVSEPLEAPMPGT
ncbi:MAG: asparagine synthase (glutamine-hydrolyzing) [Thermoanaerobaculia bacterium]